MGGSGNGLPVEQDGGAGTAGSHWDEERFGNELMTGNINEGANYFTAMSAASFADMGYVISPNYEALSDAGYVFA
ncbi:MAG TPA: leishmanolysin-related zinc metalloendopeptidase [Allosphingosinicella sp.]|nr:leishmanolysin-related zinc metalloendopeptidase [Allosphingosinicella sp.]